MNALRKSLVRAACVAAVGLGALAPIAASADAGPIYQVGPIQNTSGQGVTVVLTASALGQTTGVTGPVIAADACAAVQTSGVTIDLMVECYLVPVAGGTPQLGAPGFSPGSIAGSSLPAVAGTAGQIPSADYHLCVLAVYRDALGQAHTVPTVCSTPPL